MFKKLFYILLPHHVWRDYCDIIYFQLLNGYQTLNIDLYS